MEDKFFYDREDIDKVAAMNFIYGFIAGVGTFIILGIFIYVGIIAF